MTQQRKRRGRSEGSVFQRGDGRWVGSVSLGFDGSGKRKRRTVYADTKQEAQQKLRKLQSSADAGALADSGRLTLGEWVTHWLEHVAKPKVRLTTYERYERLARLHVVARLGRVQLGKLRRVHIERLYAELAAAGASGRSRQAVGQLVAAALNHAVEIRLLPFSPASRVPKPKPDRREMRALTPTEVSALLTAAKGLRLEALFSLAVATGMRAGEMLGLQWADFDFAAETVTIRRTLSDVKGGFHIGEPKTASGRRTITVPTFAFDVLARHRAAMLAEGNVSGPVFCTRTGQHISQSSLASQVVKPLFKRAGLSGVRVHDLRHTHASQLLSQGHSIKSVSRRLGHSSASVTLNIYAHVMPGDDAKLSESLNRLYG